VKLREIGIARRAALPLLAKFGDFDVTIRHHYTGDPLRLNAFKHKGYWYLGKNREREIMSSFARLIQKGDTVIEVGGHIGYVSLYFAKLAGDSGRVFVFEPGANNLPYTIRNLQTARNVVLVQMAVSNSAGHMPFYLEDMSGQNNSLVKDFWVLDNVAKKAFLEGQSREVLVEVITLDQFVAEKNLAPTFLKIDVEGAEFDVLEGAIETIQRYRPVLMLEVNVKHKAIYDFARRNGYGIYNDKLRPFQELPERGMPNIFCVHEDSARLAGRESSR
jgi:FkbM family methyltransferase